MRRALAALIVALLTGSIAAPVTCAGWEAAAADRMACCKHAQHANCHDQAAADNCCARHEQSRQPASTVITAAPVGPAPVVALVVPVFDAATLVHTSAAVLERSAARRLHGPPGLLAPPLRI
jgi:hypothetical protein